MLTGAYKSPADFEEGDCRRGFPRFSEENFPRNLKLVNHINEIAEKRGCTAGQLSLAWLLAQGPDIIPIPGMKRIKYLEENMGALSVKVTPSENAEIPRAVENAETHGDRYPKQLMGAFVC